MIIQRIDGDAVFDEVGHEWDQLASNSITDTPFQSLAYQRAWWQNLNPPGSNLHTILIREESGKLVAIACFYLYEGVLYFNGCVEETDYLDLITNSEQAQTAWESVFDCLNDPDFPDWASIDLCNIPSASPTREIFPELASKHGLLFSEEIHEVCPVIELPATFEEYLNILPGKQRHEIRRKLRRAQGSGARVFTIGPDDDLDQAVDEFLELLQKSTPEKMDWLNDGRRGVFHETARAAMEKGYLQLLFAEVDGQKAAALFNFKYKDRIWVYNSGLDPDVFGTLSLGVVVTAKSIEMAIEDGCSVFDFLRGSETYKYRFGATDTMIYRLHAEKTA